MEKSKKSALWNINSELYERLMRTKMPAKARKDMIKMTKLAFDILSSVK